MAHDGHHIPAGQDLIQIQALLQPKRSFSSSTLNVHGSTIIMKASLISNITVACLASALALIAGASPLPKSENLGHRHNIHDQTTSNVAFPDGQNLHEFTHAIVGNEIASSDVLHGVSASAQADSEAVTSTTYELTRRDPLPYPNGGTQSVQNQRIKLMHEIYNFLGYIRLGASQERHVTARITVMDKWLDLTRLDVENLGTVPLPAYKELVLARMRAYLDIETNNPPLWNDEEKTVAKRDLEHFYDLLRDKGYSRESVALELDQRERTGQGSAMFDLYSDFNSVLTGILAHHIL
ncbi:hypothetical protein H0H93_004600 [Arthromyces matolae]|nr:hypothetical protein H0H93_004600 [Arthromyces matolae]